jgi:hypothetical protein
MFDDKCFKPGAVMLIPNRSVLFNGQILLYAWCEFAKTTSILRCLSILFTGGNQSCRG